MGCDSSRICGPDEGPASSSTLDKPIDGKAEAEKALGEKTETDQAKASEAGGTVEGDSTDTGAGTDEVEENTPTSNTPTSKLTPRSQMDDKEDFLKFNEYVCLERNKALLEMLGPSPYDVVVIGLKNPQLEELFEKEFTAKKPFLSKSEKSFDSLDNRADADVGQFVVVTKVDGVDMSGREKVSVVQQIRQKAEGAVNIEFMGLADNKRVLYTHHFKISGQVHPLGLNILEVKAQGNELIHQSNKEILEKPKDKRRRRASHHSLVQADKFASERVKSMSPQSSTLTSPQ